MRPLRFRVWDSVNKKMDPAIYRAGEQFGHPSSSDWTAMQFTGLLDRQGKEIYDGDLPGDIYEGGRVQWCEECHGWSIGMAEIEGHCHQCDGDFMWLDFADDVKAGKVEIIGNRFEHPHLLNS